ncbi:MAG: 50S ribosomal protein P1 [Candidatus Heimdallarchaeota archaeon]|nr:MAG: 50S ribosomal protein P1 [Candidatus Heimdallarchaeota archaeon]
MQYLHAALVLHASGKKITEKGIDAIIKAAGGKPDESKIKGLVSTLTSIDIDEAIKGASLVTAAVPGVSGTAEPSKDVKEGKTEEVEEEKEEEGDDLGLSSLFG